MALELTYSDLILRSGSTSPTSSRVPPSSSILRKTSPQPLSTCVSPEVLFSTQFFIGLVSRGMSRLAYTFETSTSPRSISLCAPWVPDGLRIQE